MGVLYCLFMQSGLWDWATGQTTRPISHKDIGESMGGINYKTVQTAIRQLREAGILGYADHRGRGVKWQDGSGHANKYKLLLSAKDPTQKTGRPLVKKREAPSPKNGQHYPSSIYSNGKSDAAGRGELDKVPSGDREMELLRFNELMREHGNYGEASAALKAWKAENGQNAIAAE